METWTMSMPRNYCAECGDELYADELFACRQCRRSLDHRHEEDMPEDDAYGYSRSDLLFGGNW